MLADVQGQEPVVVAAVAGETVTTRDPLSRAYAGARLTAAPPATVRRAADLAARRVRPHAAAAPSSRSPAWPRTPSQVAQVETLHDELLGSGDGSPAQVLVARRFPVEGDVELEVRELDGDRADLDADVLTRTLAADGIDPASVRTVPRPPHRPGDRGLGAVDGDAVARLGGLARPGLRRRPRAGALPLRRAGPRPAAARGARQRAAADLPHLRRHDRQRRRRAASTSCSARSRSARSATPSRRRAAPSRRAARHAHCGRGPALLRHRRLALTERDVEAIAVEASPAVVRARAVGALDRYGRPAARRRPGRGRARATAPTGRSPDPALLATVRDAVVAASPAVAARRVTVEGPDYLPVGVGADRPARRPGRCRPGPGAGAREPWPSFLHPLRGGPDGDGWDFGAAVHLSDIARVLEAVPGVDAVTDLVLTRDGVPAGDSVRIARRPGRLRRPARRTSGTGV